MIKLIFFRKLINTALNYSIFDIKTSFILLKKMLTNAQILYDLNSKFNIKIKINIFNVAVNTILN